MSRVFSYLGRFAAIVFGFFCAAFSASAFLHLLVVGTTGLAVEAGSGALAAPLIAGVPLLALFIGYFAFLPALPFIAVAEALGRRDWLFHALSGGGVALVIVGAALVAGGGDAARLVLWFVAAGLVAGTAYWLVAGRNSGLWLRGQDAPAAAPTSRTPSES